MKTVRSETGHAFTPFLLCWDVLKPYQNVSVNSSFLELIYQDVALQLNRFGGRELNLIHALLINSDDHLLLQMLLEFGVNAETNAVYPYPAMIHTADVKGIFVELPTALHAAIAKHRRKCMMVLLNVGVRTEVKNKDGQRAVDLPNITPDEKDRLVRMHLRDLRDKS